MTTPSTYYAFGVAIAAATVIAVVFTIYLAIALVLRWNTAARSTHLVRFFLMAVSIPCIFFGLNYANIHFVLLPAIGRQQIAEANAARAQKLEKTTFVHVGDACPRVSLATIDGDNVVLPLPGKVILINFFATWCGACHMELPYIERIWTDFGNDDRFQMIVVGREETSETLRVFRQEHGISFPIAADPVREVYSLFAQQSIPRTMLVSSEGQVVFSSLGFDETGIDDLRAELNRQLGTLKESDTTKPADEHNMAAEP